MCFTMIDKDWHDCYFEFFYQCCWITSSRCFQPLHFCSLFVLKLIVLGSCRHYAGASFHSVFRCEIPSDSLSKRVDVGHFLAFSLCHALNWQAGNAWNDAKGAHHIHWENHDLFARSKQVFIWSWVEIRWNFVRMIKNFCRTFVLH